MTTKTDTRWEAAGESVLDANDGRCIATVRITDGTRATLDANAKLIAAAPDLLAALKDMTPNTPWDFTQIPAVCSYCSTSRDGGIHKPHCKWQIAKDAIAKAGGNLG